LFRLFLTAAAFVAEKNPAHFEEKTMETARLTRYFAPLTIALFGSLAQSGHADSAMSPVPDGNKVVFQVSDNDPAKWNLALNNARNVQQVLGAGKSEIEIVAYGPGINMLKTESSVADRIAQEGREGIRIVACENTMKAQKLTKNDMLGTIGYVPAGVVELMKKEHEGYAYVRP
jgi:intracellular sulfur oxidation DsrE/DsrF family protein